MAESLSSIRVGRRSLGQPHRAAIALKLVQVTKHFGPLKAVDSVSLDIRRGEVFSLLGPSGSGKTTTLRLLAGLEDPDDGEIYFDDRVVVSARKGLFVPTHKRNVGMVFQSYAIWPHMTVFDNVAYPLKVRRTPYREIRERVLEVLELVGLGGFENRPGPQLSGGQQQRVAVARALVSQPTVLLLDEPFSNLDAKLREQMRIQLKLLLNKVEITVVFVTHDQVEALGLSDRIAVMNSGRVEQVGSPEEVYDNPATPFVRDFLGRRVLLKGIVDDSSYDRIVVRVNGLGGVKLSARRRAEHEMQSGEKVFIAARAVDIRIAPSNGGLNPANSLAATLEALLFVGDHYECRVRLANDETLLVQTSRWVAFHEGDAVRLHIPEEEISLWPA